MKKLVLFSFLLASFSLNGFFTYSQTVAVIRPNVDVAFPPGSNIIVKGENIIGVDGSQYLSEEWTKGNITMNNGTIIDSIDLRLNAYKKEMHYLYKDVEYSINSPESIREVKMGNRKFIYSSYKTDKNDISKNYFEVLAEGKASLLVLYYIKRISSNYNVVLDVGNRNDQLELNEKYFITIGNSIIEIDKKGKSIFDNLGDKSDLLKKRIKEEDLSFKKKEDLIKIVSYMNEIN
ncbi:hypothetical protein [Acetobacteroides hydrogenigenes]|uniref:Uncharacterized protein n=1 Tax=Acetobacteroides hydrogenigenes TaxID=979970 RepID=A0A4R2EEQ9_9BACT|nr:hypothetical protein [Acetobacteroides hydrogenigenes]TCN65432.1 hypothetical protein CLV25_111112 [Acetobacteroides hydrogenigenes]